MEIRAKIYLTGKRFKTFGYYELTHDTLFPNTLIWQSIESTPDTTLILYKDDSDILRNTLYLIFREDDFEHCS